MRIHTFSRVAGWLTFVTLIDCMVLVLFRVTPMGIRFLAITTSEHMRGHASLKQYLHSQIKGFLIFIIILHLDEVS